MIKIDFSRRRIGLSRLTRPLKRFPTGFAVDRAEEQEAEEQEEQEEQEDQEEEEE